MLQCFASNSDLLAFAISDPKTELLDTEKIEAIDTSCVPPRLQYIIWRSQSFRLKRKLDESTQQTSFLVNRTYHPRNFRGNRSLRDWHEEMVFDHLAGDYEDQLRHCVE